MLKTWSFSFLLLFFCYDIFLAYPSSSCLASSCLIRTVSCLTSYASLDLVTRLNPIGQGFTTGDMMFDFTLNLNLLQHLVVGFYPPNIRFLPRLFLLPSSPTFLLLHSPLSLLKQLPGLLCAKQPLYCCVIIPNNFSSIIKHQPPLKLFLGLFLFLLLVTPLSLDALL